LICIIYYRTTETTKKRTASFRWDARLILALEEDFEGQITFWLLMGHPGYHKLGKGTAYIVDSTLGSPRIDDLEDDIRPGLQAIHGASELVHAGDGLLVDLNDDQTIGKADLIRKRAGLDGLDLHAVESGLGDDLRRQVAYSDAKLGLSHISRSR